MVASELKREVAENLHRLFEMRDLFDEKFVGRQAWACLQMLNGLAGAW